MYDISWKSVWVSQGPLLLKTVLVHEVMDDLTLCYLHPTCSEPSPFFVASPQLLAVAAALQENELALGLLHSHLTLSNSTLHLAWIVGVLVHAPRAHASIGSGVFIMCVWPGHLVLHMQIWNSLISHLQKLAIKSWSACQFKWNEMEPESN